MRRLLALLSLFLMLAGSLRAEQPVVVELYTSQGCSACPPADRLLRDLAMRSDVIAIALHVDYWDYIGWADSFADPRFTRRQKSYARAAGHGTVYTPQFVVGGTDHVVGTRPHELVERIAAHEALPETVSLEASRQGDVLHVEADGAVGPYVVQLVRILPSATVEILSGENAGHRLTYGRIATDWQVIAEWTAAEPLALDVPLTGPEAAVVIVQQTGMGRIAAATEVAGN